MTDTVPGWAVATPTMRQCELCLRRAPDVAVVLVKWRDPLPGQVFGKAARCRDHAACRKRVEGFGDVWAIDDGTPATRPHAGEVPVLGPRPSTTPAIPETTAEGGGPDARPVAAAQAPVDEAGAALDATPAPASEPPELDFG